MNPLYDTLFIISFKVLLLVGFVALIKFWLNKKYNNVPFAVYWILGVFFVLATSSQVFEWLLGTFFFKENSNLGSKEALTSLGTLLGLILYFYIGFKFLKRKKSIYYN